MKISALFLTIVFVFQQQSCDVQQLTRDQIEPAIESQFLGQIQQYFPNAKRIHGGGAEPGEIAIDTGVSGVTKKFVQELAPELGRKGLYELTEAQNQFNPAPGSLQPIRYENAFFLFNAPLNVQEYADANQDLPLAVLVLIWSATYNAGIALTLQEMDACDQGDPSCQAFLENSAREQRQ